MPPSRTTSPTFRSACFTCFSLTNVPLLEFASTTWQVVPSHTNRAWSRLTRGSGSSRLHSESRPATNSVDTGTTTPARAPLRKTSSSTLSGLLSEARWVKSPPVHLLRRIRSTRCLTSRREGGA